MSGPTKRCESVEIEIGPVWLQRIWRGGARTGRSGSWLRTWDDVSRQRPESHAECRAGIARHPPHYVPIYGPSRICFKAADKNKNQRLTPEPTQKWVFDQWCASAERCTHRLLHASTLVSNHSRFSAP